MKWLTRTQIDKVIDGMSAADLIAASAIKDANAGQQAETAFNAAAARQGISNGVAAMEAVRASDFAYLAGKMAEIMEASSPKSDDTEG